MKLERLFAITTLLMNRKRITALELAEYFEVSARTIYRDIEAIGQAGIPIVTYQGAGGGYEIMDNYKIDRQMFTADDFNSIMIALKGVATTYDDQKFASAISKLKLLTPETVNNSLTPDQLILDFSPWGGKTYQDKLELLKKAISECWVVEFKYTNYLGEISNRTVEPLTLILKGLTWYFHGFCRTRNDYRNFRLSRIRDLKIGGVKFQPRERTAEHYKIEDEWKPEHTVKLVLRFAPRLRSVIEDYYDADNVRTDAEGFLIVEAFFPDDEWSYNQILHFGEGVEVLEPESFRAVIREKARRILEKY